MDTPDETFHNYRIILCSKNFILTISENYFLKKYKQIMKAAMRVSMLIMVRLLVSQMTQNTGPVQNACISLELSAFIRLKLMC